MPYYIRTLPDGTPHGGVWHLDDNTALRIDVGPGPGANYSRVGELSMLETIRRTETHWFEAQGGFHQLTLAPGEYYPRMARPNNAYPHESPGSNPGHRDALDFIAVARGQLFALAAQLHRICQTVHPVDGTLDVYGHDIRNLLILACTEVEAHWRGVFVANGHRKPRYTVRDYVELDRAMGLERYAVLFLNFPWLPPVRPFDGWTVNKGRLPWYQAYNAVKHNREEEFHKGSLRRAFEAVSACFAMLCAQFGSVNTIRGTELQGVMALADAPAWPLAEVYTHPYGAGGYRAVNYPF